MSRLSNARMIVPVIVAVAALSAATPAFGARNSGGGTTTGSAGCAVSPSPVVVDSSYSVVGSGLRANVIVDVLVTDSAGATSSTTAMTDNTGHVVVGAHAWVTGQGSVQITDTSRKHNLLAHCVFSITSS
jgi:hypothetical protein